MVAVLVGVYGAALVLGRMSRLPGTPLALVWPAAAVGFVWLWWSSHHGRRFLAGNVVLLAVIAAVVNGWTGAAPVVAAVLGLANAVQAVVECLVLSRLRPQAWRLEAPRDLMVWVVACVVGSVAGACIGPFALAATAEGTQFWAVAWVWILRNAANTFVFGAVALRVAASGMRSLLPPRQQWLELSAAIAAMCGAYGLVFGNPQGLPLGYAVLPLSIWISLRFSTTITAAHVLISALLVVVPTMAGRGPFATVAPTTRVLLAQAFVAVVALVALLLALHRDERARLIASLEQARLRADQHADQLRRASEHKSQFLAMMSHEIRTPLNGVLGFNALLAAAPHDPSAAEWARSADTTGRALLSVVNDSLDLAKIEAGGVELEQIEFDLLAVAREALVPSQLAANDKGVGLRLLVGDGLHRSRHGDPARLRQILTNLVANAVKFTDHGSVGLALDDDTEAGDGGTDSGGGGIDHGDRVRIEVIDTGIGMTGQQLERLFVPFQQASADTTRRYGGTGLGLSIAHGLVEAMGGTITAMSTPNQGTTFTIALPLPRSRGRRIHEAPVTAPADDELATLRGLHVLVAEDNTLNQMLARATFQARGLQVDVVDDGEQAVTAALSGRYDAVFMDCQMPTMDGLEATRRIRGAETGRLPVIAMTASAFHDERQACLDAGMDDVLPKPWTAAELTDVLTRLALHHHPS
jgi:signal transduction histidine kinase/CheY-like chemotaxis protein